MNHQAERDRRAKAYSYRAYRRRVQQAQAVWCACNRPGPAGRSGAGAGYSGGSEPMKKQLIVTTVYLFFLLALVALIEIVWNQEPEQPVIETPAATTTPAPTPTGPLTIQITGLEGAESIDDVWAAIVIPH